MVETPEPDTIPLTVKPSDVTLCIVETPEPDTTPFTVKPAAGGASQTYPMILEGYIRIPSTEILNVPGSGAVDGLPVYVSKTAGHFDFTAPSGAGDFVRIVGYAIDDHSGDVLIYFNSDKTWVEVG